MASLMSTSHFNPDVNHIYMHSPKTLLLLGQPGIFKYNLIKTKELAKHK